MRAFKGGHSASERLLRDIREASLANLPCAIHEMDFIRVFDNSVWGHEPQVLLEAASGEIVYLADDLPAWLTAALARL